MQIQIPHKRTKQQAIDQIKKALEEARPKLAGQATIEKEEWVGDTLEFAVTVQGQHISGSVATNETEYDLVLKLPLMLRMFEGKIKRTIEEQLKQLPQN
ncbi:MAG: hypothetical protein JWO43_202 [Candidatus Adlerbacteria bacterium]|nr:hypothetical protein [Candidatus Adlerbacteria bacterium]